MTNATTVLIIEDEPALRRGLAARLEDSGYQVLEAEGGKQGLDIFLRDHPDVVVTDLRMSGMDGLITISEVKSRSPQTPVIVVSGTGDASLMEEALSRGADSYLRKPISNLEDLDVAIERVLRRQDS